MKAILSYILKYKKRLLLGLGALLIVDLAQLIVPLIIRKAVDEIAQGGISAQGLLIYGIYIVVLALVVALFRFFWRYFVMGVSRRIEEEMRNRLFSHFLSLSYDFYQKRKTGDLMAHTTNDIDAVRMVTGVGVVATADVFIYSIFALSAMFYISPTLTLYTMTPLIPLSLVVFFFGRAIYSRFEDVQASFSQLTERVRESLEGIRVIKSFVQKKGAEKHFFKVNEDYVIKNLRLVKVWGMFFPLINLFAGIALAILLLFGGIKVIFGEVTLGDFVAFTSYLGMMIWPMIAVGWVVNIVERGKASMERIDRILKVTPTIRDKEPAIEKEIEGRISIQDLSFKYENNESYVLRDVNIEIAQGKKIGIIGRTGSGKTTLLSLIPRVWDPPPGTIFLDGIDVRELKLEILRKSIAFVPQEALLFSDTIRENIAFYKSNVSDDEVEKIAKMVDIYDEIMEFPDGFDTIIGEKGITLSGGQRQRIALARALLLDTPILILDDTLSQVDTETERKIIDNLREFIRKRTAIIVSHRISGIQNSDEILVMEGGRIIERGNHSELIIREGLYRRLYEYQMLEQAIEKK